MTAGGTWNATLGSGGWTVTNNTSTPIRFISGGSYGYFVDVDGFRSFRCKRGQWSRLPGHPWKFRRDAK